MIISRLAAHQTNQGTDASAYGVTTASYTAPGQSAQASGGYPIATTVPNYGVNSPAASTGYPTTTAGGATPGTTGLGASGSYGRARMARRRIPRPAPRRCRQPAHDEPRLQLAAAVFRAGATRFTGASDGAHPYLIRRHCRATDLFPCFLTATMPAHAADQVRARLAGSRAEASPPRSPAFCRGGRIKPRNRRLVTSP